MRINFSNEQIAVAQHGLMQYEFGQYLEIYNLQSDKKYLRADFYNTEDDSICYSQLIILEAEHYEVRVPDELLTIGNDIILYIVDETEEELTNIAKILLYVEKRPLGEDYESPEYTDLVGEILEKLEKLEPGSSSDETVNHKIFKTVVELPEQGEENVIYFLVNDTITEKDHFSEWAFINNKWEQIGVNFKAENIEVDLSNYYTKNEVDELIPDTSEFLTQEEVKDLIPDTSKFITEDEAKALIPNTSNFVTAEDVKEMLPDTSIYAKSIDLNNYVENEKHENDINEINNNISANYYNKTDVDDKIKVVTEQIPNITNLATKSEVKESYVDKTTYAEDKNTTNLAIQSNTTKFTEYYNKTEIDNKISVINENIPNISNLTSKEYVDTEIAKINGVEYVSVTELPEKPDIGKEKAFYLVQTSQSDNNMFDEYIWHNNKWELFGVTKIDLSDYYTKSEVNELIPDTSKLLSITNAANTYLRQDTYANDKNAIDAQLIGFNNNFSNYYTKQETGEMIHAVREQIPDTSNFVTEAQVSDGYVSKSNYSTDKTSMNSAIQSNTTKFNNYYTKTEIDTKLNSYGTIDYIDEKIGEIEALLSSI
jgi:hypothetical protein